MTKLKYCEEGNHEVTQLFWAKSKTRKSACASCARKYSKPLSSKVKVIESWNPLNEPKSSPVIKPKHKYSKSIPELLKLVTIVFNKWIRERDSINGTTICISCSGWFKNGWYAGVQAGHYMPSTYSTLRFNEINVNSECEQCNCHDPNHLIGYRKNLINKIGLEKVLELESTPISKSHKWDRDELLEIINRYK